MQIMNIKNKIAFYITGILMILISFSCDDEFLEKNPLDEISSEAFWNSEDDVEMAVTGCYARMKNTFLNYQRGYLDGLSDNGLDYWNIYNIQTMALGTINANTGGVINDVYDGCYAGISQCNFFMGNVDNAINVDESVLNKAIGEVRFLRALFYFDLVNCFGDVVLYKETPESADASKTTKSTSAEVLDFINEDLDYAIANLPDEPYSNGHAVKGSAMALKTRVLLTEEKWSEAATVAKQIIDGGKFGVYDNYANMFINGGQIGNNEIMFSCDYLGPDDYHSIYGMNIEYTAHIFLTQDLMDAYECNDGKSISESSLYDPENPYDNRDPRLKATIRLPEENWEGFYDYTTFNPTGVLNKKGADTTIPATYSNAYLNDWNWILLRYADVLLMYAEAQNETAGPDQSVYDAIDEVRARPGIDMPPVDQSKYNTKESLRDFIRHERRIEFAVEGIRYFDLKRWHIIGDVINSLPEVFSGGFYSFDEKHYHWPFPQSELDRNPNLVQTDGY